jgi:hypothetical protein
MIAASRRIDFVIRYSVILILRFSFRSHCSLRAQPLETPEVSKKFGSRCARLFSFDRHSFPIGYWPFHPVLCSNETRVVDSDFCCHRVVLDATGHRKCGHRRSRIPFLLPSMLWRSLFFLDAGPPSVRFRLSLRLLLRLR